MLSYLLRTLTGMGRRDDALLRVELARLEGSITNLTQTVTAQHSAFAADLLERDKRIDDHEARIRVNERWRAALPPTLFLAAASILANIVSLFHH